MIYIRNKNNRPAVVLLLTIVVLVIMCGIGYVLTTKVAAARHRDQYLVDYQKARYASDSAFKYVNTILAEQSFTLIDRPNEPDFSDLFAFTEEQYKIFLEDYVREKLLKQQYGENWKEYETQYKRDANDPNSRDSRDQLSPGDFNDPNYTYNQDINDFNQFDLRGSGGADDPNKIVIPGPYGAAWPFVTEPIEFEVGDAKVTVEIEDENAKLPMAWAMRLDDKNKRSTESAYDSFFDWIASASRNEVMVTYQQRYDFYDGLKKVGEYVDVNGAAAITPAAKEPNKASATPAQKFRSRRARQRAQAAQTQLMQNSPNAKYANIISLVNSSLVNLEDFAKPYIKSQRRTESALKYMSRYGAMQVNVNSAPRLVLESVFMFGGDAVQTAQNIIDERKIKPLADINDLQKRCFHYANSIQRAKDYLTTKSTFFTVRIQSASGAAIVRYTALILKDGKNVQILAIIAQ